KLAVLRGQAVDLRLNGEELATGSGGSRIALGRIAASAKIADALGTPFGFGQAALAGITFASGNLAKVSLNLDSAGPGRFTFRADASGNVQAPLTVGLNGTAEITARTGAFELQVARLKGNL